MFLLIIISLYVTINVASSFLLSLVVPDPFANSLAQSMVSGLSFLFTFVAVARHYVSTVPRRFWAKFLVLALVLFLFYATLALAFGEPLLTAMGFQVSPLPPGSPLTQSEYAILAFYTYGISSITNGLLSVAVAFYLQKYMVRGVFLAFKRLTKYRNFTEGGTTEGKSSILVYSLWLILLPFPIQHVLSPTPVGVSVLGTGLYLLAALAVFALWGLGLAAFVSITERNVFRLYNVFRDTLFWFLVIQWFSAVVYSSFAPPILANFLVVSGLLLIRVFFAFGPPGLMTAYLYKGALEQRAEKRIVEYLREKEKLETAKIEVKAE